MSFARPRRWLAPVGGAALAGALVAVLALLFVPRAPEVAHESKLVLAAASAQRAPELPEETLVHVDGFAEATEPQPQPLKPPGDMRCGSAAMGTLVEDTRGRYEVSGPKDNADPHLAREVAGNGYPTATALDISGEIGRARTPVGSAGLTAPFGHDAALGRDETNARGRMWGEQVAEAAGERGLGLAARAGGVVKRIDVAPAADKTTALRVVHTGLRVSGARKASEIGRAMAAHFDDFRRCGEAAPQGEARRVELDFDVAADGRISTTPAEATRLEQCLAESASRVSFAADANGPTRVVYPLHFVLATAELRTPPTEREREAPCDCGG